MILKNPLFAATKSGANSAGATFPPKKLVDFSSF